MSSKIREKLIFYKVKIENVITIWDKLLEYDIEFPGIYFNKKTGHVDIL